MQPNIETINALGSISTEHAIRYINNCARAGEPQIALARELHRWALNSIPPTDQDIGPIYIHLALAISDNLDEVLGLLDPPTEEYADGRDFTPLYGP